MGWEGEFNRQDDTEVTPRRPLFAEKTVLWVISCLNWYIVKSIVAIIVSLMVLAYQVHQRQIANQKALEQHWREVEKAAHEGKTGEAFRRLFGVNSPPELSTPFMLPERLED